MIRKILIANRGEIAVRIARTCETMGIQSVAIYSDADRHAPHVQRASEAWYAGGPAARESYLNIPRIVGIATASGADAVHPGYGFLSENADFARAVEDAGITFIGPTPGAIRAIGDKTSARAIARSLGIPMVPGTIDPLATLEEARSVAKSIGYPVLLKAAAGGGGKGMRVVENDRSMEAGFRSARSEALASFADDRLYLEKYILGPRHIEVQVLSDGKSNTIHLGERECTIQRRHQKILEESPSPSINPATREEITHAAVKLLAGIGYRSAGTVEFLMDEEGRFYFMEVNARLQVEHPVTEMRTGLDIVREQIMVASGEGLSVEQAGVKFSGHAIECRVCAEDSHDNFAPFTGTVEHVSHPEGEGVRVDTGVESGSEVSPYYDPMISKVITFADDRPTAIGRMVDALNQYEIAGVKVNLDLCLWILSRPEFRNNRLTTNFLRDHFRSEYLAKSNGYAEKGELAAMIAAFVHDEIERTRFASATRSPGDWAAAREEEYR